MPPMVCTLFSAISIGIIVFGILGNLLKGKNCTERIDAVCVDVHSKISSDADGNRTLLYKPFYYIKYNGKGYILFSDTWTNYDSPEVGDIVTSIYINPDNPMDYYKKMPASELIPLLLSSTGFLLPIIVTLKDFFRA